MFVRAGQSGFMYDFFLYSGKSSNKNETGSCEKVVLRLFVLRLFKMFFDNWFCTMPLLLTMQSFGILTTATERANRLAGCPLRSQNELKKDGRGSLSYKTDANSGILLLRWYDNKSVQLAFTVFSPDVSGTVKRKNSKTKKTCSSTVSRNCETI